MTERTPRMHLMRSAPGTDDTALAPSYAEDVRAGLSATPKTLPTKLLYDELGSQLFEAICFLPEYYLTRTEGAILDQYADEIVGNTQAGCRLVELGAGSAAKTRLLLRAMAKRDPHLVYCPIDISMEAMRIAQANVTSEFPDVRFKPVLGDWFESLAQMSGQDPMQKLILFLGSSIGNLTRTEAIEFLDGVRAVMGPTDMLLVGTDMVKDEGALLAAYDDAAGVTAAFNKNLLVRINQSLGGHFDTRTFEHRARWDPVLRRIEMHLVSKRAQSVRIDGLDLEVRFGAGESIHTENSHKYRLEDVWDMAQSAGLRVHHTYQDAARAFAVHLMGRP